MTLLRRALTALRGLVPALPAGAGRTGRRAARTPRTSLRTGPSVPALVLRLGLLALSVAGGALVADGSQQWGVVAAVALGVALRPHAALLALGVALLGGMFLLSGEHWWQLPGLVLATHAVLRLGAVADAVSWRGRVELAVLADGLPAFLAVQAAAQVAVVLALVLEGATPVPWLVVGGLGALGVLSWVVVLQVRAARR